MSFEFADCLRETRFRDLNEALTHLDSHPIKDVIVPTSNIRFHSPSEVRLPSGRSYAMTQSAFVQLIHFARVNWADVRYNDESTILKSVRKRRHGKRWISEAHRAPEGAAAAPVACEPHRSGRRTDNIIPSVIARETAKSRVLW